MAADALTRFRRWVERQEKTGKNRTQVAALIGCSEGGLSRVLSGKRGVGGAMGAKIERATRGRVKAIHWHPPLEKTGS